MEEQSVGRRHLPPDEITTNMKNYVAPGIRRLQHHVCPPAKWNVMSKPPSTPASLHINVPQDQSVADPPPPRSGPILFQTLFSTNDTVVPESINIISSLPAFFSPLVPTPCNVTNGGVWSPPTPPVPSSTFSVDHASLPKFMKLVDVLSRNGVR
ncbi:hypothetical protein HPP92_028709 [Vanilla planifolia]|uniref:Uncharacterized protein n=1 Tax=Vanilla planifolia TaxID=51239 RepID=A0A835P9Y4_VANPL|nr:hypothetical protein HPP92_028709 [Vanilla planifolia]KAG0446716.1 hypothetical protein HPP92_028692 [Vanilla planifolia]